MRRGVTAASRADLDGSSSGQPPADMALVLSIFQTRYVPHILLALTEGPLGFTALLGRTGVASAGTLSARLQDLQRWRLAQHAGRLYSLLPAGRASVSVLRQMQLWSERHPESRIPGDHALLQRTGSLAIIYALMTRPLRVRDLSGQVRLVSRRSLLHRLQELTQAGFLRRQGSAAPVQYSLTELGQSLRPIMDELTVWLAMYRALNFPPGPPGEAPDGGSARNGAAEAPPVTEPE